jgi:hypothetical protein
MKKVLKRILWILSTVFFSRSLDQPSCLTTAFLKILTRVVSLVFLVLSYAWVPGTEEVETNEGKTYKRVATQNREQACTVEGAIVWQINRHRNEGNTVQRQSTLPLCLSVLFLACCCEPAVSTVALRQRASEAELDCAAKHLAKARLSLFLATSNHHLELFSVGVRP